MSEQEEQKVEVKPKSEKKTTQEGDDAPADGKKEKRSSRLFITFLTQYRTQG